MDLAFLTTVEPTGPTTMEEPRTMEDARGASDTMLTLQRGLEYLKRSFGTKTVCDGSFSRVPCRRWAFEISILDADLLYLGAIQILITFY